MLINTLKKAALAASCLKAKLLFSSVLLARGPAQYLFCGCKGTYIILYNQYCGMDIYGYLTYFIFFKFFLCHLFLWSKKLFAKFAYTAVTKDRSPYMSPPHVSPHVSPHVYLHV